jgi:type VI secretion system protein ImpG
VKLNELLPYYERELGLLRRYLREFAERHPQIAGNLLMAGEVCEDPRIARMIQSCALLNARAAKRLDDDYPEFTEALFEVLYPHYLRPFPSCSIVRFDYGDSASKLAGANTIKRGTELKTLPVKGVKCQFQTVYDVTVAPVALSHASFDAILTAPAALILPPAATSKISLSITTTADRVGLAQLGLASLRVFIDGETAFCAGLKYTLFIHTVRAYVEFSGNGRWTALDKTPIRAVGFEEDEALLPFPGRSLPAYRLLTEYFSYPDKFNFFDIDLQAINRLMPEACQGFTLHLTLCALRSHSTGARLLGTLAANNMLLGCTPVINAFKQHGEPITLTHAMEHYPVVANSRSAFAYEVLAIDSLELACDCPHGNPAITEVRPLHSLRHGEVIEQAGHYWTMRRDDAVALKRPGHETEIAIVDRDCNRSLIETGTLSIALTCSNRDLPSSLSYGLPAGDLSMKGAVIKFPIRFLRKPTEPYRFKRGEGAHWRLISHLSPNHLALERGGLAAFREMLTLYNLPGLATSRRQIGGIAAIEHKAFNAWMPGDVPPRLMRGIEVRIVISEDDFAGTDLHGFAHVLEQFFALYIHANNFTQLLMVSERSGEELLRCLPRNGTLSLL